MHLRSTMIISSLLSCVLLLTAACAGTSVQPGQRGLFWHPFTEGLSSEPLKAGFYWRAPWNDVYVYDVRWQSYVETVDALSSDDLLVKLRTAVIMRPIPEEVYFMAQEIGWDFYPRVVKPELLAAVRSVVSGYAMVTVPENSVEIASKVQAVVVEKIARRRAKGEGDAIRIRSDGEAEGLRIRVSGQAKAQETIAKTITPQYLQFKLYDSQNSKFVLLPDKLNVPILLNPGTDQPRQPMSDDLSPR